MPLAPLRRPAPRLLARLWLPSMPWLELLGFAVLIALAVSQRL